MAEKKVQELFLELEGGLKGRFDERERANIIFLLFKQFMDFDRADLVLSFNNMVPEEKLELFQAAQARLLDGEPVQHITGMVEFLDLVLEVGPDVLIPRPETEELAHMIIDKEKPKRILDIGTGSGCIAIALAKAFPKAKVVATDLSEEALQRATSNLQLNNAKVEFRQHDILTENLSSLGKFDLIVSNPPYIGEEEREELAQHVIDHEPHLALFAYSHDAMIFYRAIAEKAKAALNSGGRLYFELNAKYARLIAELVEEMGYSEVKLHRDMQGKERFLICSSN